MVAVALVGKTLLALLAQQTLVAVVVALVVTTQQAVERAAPAS